MAHNLYSFQDHPEHEARLKEYADKWIAIALRTRPQDDHDREAATVAIRGVYRAAKLEPPPREVFVASPVSGAIASTIASCVWWLREHPEQHKALFGRRVTEQEIVEATLPAVSIAVRAGLGIPVEHLPATDQATRQATRQATEQATDQAAWQATLQSTEQATRQATLQATWQATLQATRQATEQATDQATLQATEQATEQATRQATWQATPIIRFYLAAVSKWGSLYNGGNQWAGYCSYLNFFREVAKLELPEHEGWIHYEQAAIHAGPRFVHPKFWIASDFPLRVCRDEQFRPHSATGPALVWCDGWPQYYWHGVQVPREWIESPQTLDPKTAITHDNAEQRRCAAEIIGWDRVLSKLEARTIDTDADPQIGELVEVTIDDREERFLRVRCGTGRHFALPVPPDTATALAAQAWIHDLPEETIRALEVRT